MADPALMLRYSELSPEAKREMDALINMLDGDFRRDMEAIREQDEERMVWAFRLFTRWWEMYTAPQEAWVQFDRMFAAALACVRPQEGREGASKDG